MGTIIKTIPEVQINTKVLGTNGGEVLYYELIGEQRFDEAEFKGQKGVYTYLIGIKVMRDGQLVEANKIYPMLKPFQASYKLSTWMTLFGGMTPAQIEAKKPQLMIKQFAYNAADYGGLTEEDYEVYNPVT